MTTTTHIRKDVKRGYPVGQRGKCPSCGYLQYVTHRMWFRASKPRCNSCGDILIPSIGLRGTLGLKLPKKIVKTEADERVAMLNQSKGGHPKRRHNCFAKDCPSTVDARFPFCAFHGPTLIAINKPLATKLMRLFRLLHQKNWTSSTKTLALWRISLAHANRLLSKAQVAETSHPK